MGQLTGKFRYLIIVIGSAASPASCTHVGKRSAGVVSSKAWYIGTSVQVRSSGVMKLTVTFVTDICFLATVS